MLRMPLEIVKMIAMIHITKAPIFKHLLSKFRPTPRVNEPAMITKIPDQIPPELMLPHQLVATKSMMTTRKIVMIPLVRIMLPSTQNIIEVPSQVNYQITNCTQLKLYTTILLRISLHQKYTRVIFTK